MVEKIKSVVWIMDIEGIQISKDHCCIREISLVSYFTNEIINIHCAPCEDYECLEENLTN